MAEESAGRITRVSTKTRNNSTPLLAAGLGIIGMGAAFFLGRHYSATESKNQEPTPITATAPTTQETLEAKTNTLEITSGKENIIILPYRIDDVNLRDKEKPAWHMALPLAENEVAYHGFTQLNRNSIIPVKLVPYNESNETMNPRAREVTAAGNGEDVFLVNVTFGKDGIYINNTGVQKEHKLLLNPICLEAMVENDNGLTRKRLIQRTIEGMDKVTINGQNYLTDVAVLPCGLDFAYPRVFIPYNGDKAEDLKPVVVRERRTDGTNITRIGVQGRIYVTVYGTSIIMPPVTSQPSSILVP